MTRISRTELPRTIGQGQGVHIHRLAADHLVGVARQGHAARKRHAVAEFERAGEAHAGVVGKVTGVEGLADEVVRQIQVIDRARHRVEHPGEGGVQHVGLEAQGSGVGGVAGLDDLKKHPICDLNQAGGGTEAARHAAIGHDGENLVVGGTVTVVERHIELAVQARQASDVDIVKVAVAGMRSVSRGGTPDFDLGGAGSRVDDRGHVAVTGRIAWAPEAVVVDRALDGAAALEGGARTDKQALGGGRQVLGQLGQVKHAAGLQDLKTGRRGHGVDQRIPGREVETGAGLSRIGGHWRRVEVKGKTGSARSTQPTGGVGCAAWQRSKVECFAAVKAQHIGAQHIGARSCAVSATAGRGQADKQRCVSQRNRCTGRLQRQIDAGRLETEFGGGCAPQKTLQQLRRRQHRVGGLLRVLLEGIGLGLLLVVSGGQSLRQQQNRISRQQNPGFQGLDPECVAHPC